MKKRIVIISIVCSLFMIGKIDTTTNAVVFKDKYINNVMLNKIYLTKVSDYYMFTPEVSGSYEILLRCKDDINLKIYDSENGKLIDRGIKCYQGEINISRTLLSGKTYLIKLESNLSCLENNRYFLEVRKLNIPSDEVFKDQWALLNEENEVDINVTPAWNYSKGDNIKIGIFDTGTYYEHEDLKDNVDEDLIYNFTHDNKDIFPLDEKISKKSAKVGHGTLVAGIVGASDKNGIGIVGIAPESTLIPVKVLGSKIEGHDVYNGTVISFIKAIEYAKENDIKIINCSFGGLKPSFFEWQAIKAADDILFVMAAGNSAMDLVEEPEYPACYYCDNVLVVSAIDRDGNFCEFSNYGGPVRIAAPGMDIISSYPDDSYEYGTGTSMASPMVTGVCSLIWSQNESLSVRDVIAKVCDESSVNKLECLKDKVISNGYINAFKAINSSKTSADLVGYNGYGISDDIIMSKIKNYESENDKESNIILVKFKPAEQDIEKNILLLKQECNLKKYEYIGLIDTYIFEFGSNSEASNAIKRLDNSIEYVEFNISRT